MAEDGDTKTNEGDTTGKGDNNPTPADTTPKPDNDQTTNALDRAEASNKEKERLLEDEKKLMDRKEKLHAAQMVGGHTVGGQAPEAPKEETKEELAERFDKGEVDLLK